MTTEDDSRSVAKDMEVKKKLVGNKHTKELEPHDQVYHSFILTHPHLFFLTAGNAGFNYFIYAYNIFASFKVQFFISVRSLFLCCKMFIKILYAV